MKLGGGVEARSEVQCSPAKRAFYFTPRQATRTLGYSLSPCPVQYLGVRVGTRTFVPSYSRYVSGNDHDQDHDHDLDLDLDPE